ncbi:MAG TPA: methylated-DNA--[protein]-cysteine S-methyltransferase [Pseudobdellovibrionaceae bacterium]|nr:methylated-DNA--[protein]-cysteine S-methyltransferase [Pseudobdellovibrionaceae bacterium]
MNDSNFLHMKSPLGNLILRANDSFLLSCEFENKNTPDLRQAQFNSKDHKMGPSFLILKSAHQQLQEYFQKKRKHFELPLLLQGTSFQKKVWELLLQIPYGETQSYSELARSLNSKAFQATGAALGKNPLPLFYPCHRVVGKDGSLTGYSGGLKAKKILLMLEKF